MKHNYKHITSVYLAIISASLIMMFQNGNAQPGYRIRVPMPRYQPGYGPYPPPQSARQVYGPGYPVNSPLPFMSVGIHFDPIISWFSTDSYNVHNDGAVPGFNFGFSYNRYFSPNYSFSSGINIINAGGRLISNEITHLQLKNYNYDLIVVQPGEAITYRITYLSIPLGFKLQSNQIGYGIFFTDFGFDPKIVIGGRADIPSLSINGGNVISELRTFNLSFHVMAGMEYPLGGNSRVVFGIGFENNFFDVTGDNGYETYDVVTHKLLSFRIGFIF
jgi:hypothetical protein